MMLVKLNNFKDWKNKKEPYGSLYIFNLDFVFCFGSSILF